MTDARRAADMHSKEILRVSGVFLFALGVEPTEGNKLFAGRSRFVSVYRTAAVGPLATREKTELAAFSCCDAQS